MPSRSSTRRFRSCSYAVEPTNNPKNEIGFKVTRTLTKTTDATATTPAASSTDITVAMVPANAESWLDTQAVPM